MKINKMIICCVVIMSAFISSQLYAAFPIKAEGMAEIYLSDDNWTIDKNSMEVINVKNCTAKVKYEHDGKTKTIGSCTHIGSADEIRGDFHFDFGAKVLFRNDNSKGFSLQAKNVICSYQLQTMGPPTFNYYYYVDCKVDDKNTSITPFGNNPCPKQCTVKIDNFEGGVLLRPTCN